MNMYKGPMKIYWGDQEITADVVELTFNSEYEDYPRLDGSVASIMTNHTIEIRGQLISTKENIMGYSDKACEGYVDQASAYREIQMGAEHLELRKAGLINANGTLNDAGSRLLLELLLDKNKTKLVEAAKLLNKKD